MSLLNCVGRFYSKQSLMQGMLFSMKLMFDLIQASQAMPYCFVLVNIICRLLVTDTGKVKLHQHFLEKICQLLFLISEARSDVEISRKYRCVFRRAAPYKVEQSFQCVNNILHQIMAYFYYLKIVYSNV